MGLIHVKHYCIKIKYLAIVIFTYLKNASKHVSFKNQYTCNSRRKQTFFNVRLRTNKVSKPSKLIHLHKIICL